MYFGRRHVPNSFIKQKKLKNAWAFDPESWQLDR
jgi:hypothetical protein